MSNDYQPITATPQRTFFRFAAQGENVVAFRCTIPRSEFEGDVGAHPLGCQIVAEQLIWAALAEASLRPGHDDHVDVGLPDCVDAPIPGNSKVVLLQPTTLSAAQVSENLVAVRETITSMRASWPAAYRLAEAWIGAALAKDNALGRGDVRLLRAALYPLSALGASQSEDAVVPPGSVGFARFLPTRRHLPRHPHAHGPAPRQRHGGRRRLAHGRAAGFQSLWPGGAAGHRSLRVSRAVRHSFYQHRYPAYPMKRPVDHLDPHKNYTLLALDPGNEKTGWALWAEGDGDKPSATGDSPNAEIRQLLRVARDLHPIDQIACEFPFPRGETAKWQVFVTCLEVGRYEEIVKGREEADGMYEGPVPAIAMASAMPFYRADRADIKAHLCKGKGKPNDAMVRAAIIQRFGGKEVALAKGTKARKKTKMDAMLRQEPPLPVAEGPLVGVVGDAWQALAVGLAFRDGALPDEAERRRRELAQAQSKAAKAAKAAQRLIDKQSVSQAV